MHATAPSIALQGYEASPVAVECRLARGLPALLIVGIASRSVREATERVRGAFAASHLKLPTRRIVINLAPADLPKDGTALDLAIAASILLAEQGSYRLQPRSLLLGELSLDGSVKPVRGLIGALLAARRHGYQAVYIPAVQYQQASLVPGLTLIPVASLQELARDLSSYSRLPRRPSGSVTPPASSSCQNPDFTDVVGQVRAKRALEIAAAGRHNILLTGPPGTGKSLLAKALPSILPPLTTDQILEISHLHSLAGPLYRQLITSPPVRSPHHSASVRAIIGGGSPPRPGEISLSHHGVLFLDELPEFARPTLEALRQPLEDGYVIIARAQGKLTFPANFTLVATANPCPCGFYGSDRACRCPTGRVIAYQHRLSGPLLDRIDLYVEVEQIDHHHLLSQPSTETSKIIRARVVRARGYRRGPPSSRLTAAQLRKTLSPSAKALLDEAASQLQLSARGYLQTAKVARTIADLATSPSIEPEHLSEAIQYRHRPSS